MGAQSRAPKTTNNNNYNTTATENAPLAMLTTRPGTRCALQSQKARRRSYLRATLAKAFTLCGTQRRHPGRDRCDLPAERQRSKSINTSKIPPPKLRHEGITLPPKPMSRTTIPQSSEKIEQLSSQRQKQRKLTGRSKMWPRLGRLCPALLLTDPVRSFGNLSCK